MALKAQYGKSTRTQLRHFPVWDIGASVALGDYGVVSDHCFTKLGNVVEEFQATVVADPTPAAAAYWEFTTAGTKEIEGKLEVAAGAEATLELQFESASSIFIRADSSRVLSIGNAAEVGLQLRNRQLRKWDRSHVFVSSVRVARTFSVLMNTHKGSTITLKATPEVLASFRTGKLGAGATIHVSGDAGLKELGASGAIYVDLMRLSFLGGTDPVRAEDYELEPVSPELEQ